MSAKIGKELYVTTPNKIGMLSEITGAIADTGTNIEAICAYAMEGEAYFMIVSGDNDKAKSALGKYKVNESEVVVVKMENKVGLAKEMADKLKAANIDLHYIYGTTSGSGPAILVLKADNNAEAVKVLS